MHFRSQLREIKPVYHCRTWNLVLDFCIQCSNLQILRSKYGRKNYVKLFKRSYYPKIYLARPKNPKWYIWLHRWTSKIHVHIHHFVSLILQKLLLLSELLFSWKKCRKVCKFGFAKKKYCQQKWHLKQEPKFQECGMWYITFLANQKSSCAHTTFCFLHFTNIDFSWKHAEKSAISYFQK